MGADRAGVASKSRPTPAALYGDEADNDDPTAVYGDDPYVDVSPVAAVSEYGEVTACGGDDSPNEEDDTLL